MNERSYGAEPIALVRLERTDHKTIAIDPGRVIAIEQGQGNLCRVVLETIGSTTYAQTVVGAEAEVTAIIEQGRRKCAHNLVAALLNSKRRKEMEKASGEIAAAELRKALPDLVSKTLDTILPQALTAELSRITSESEADDEAGEPATAGQAD